jgi:GWxTD domain-containing protein
MIRRAALVLLTATTAVFAAEAATMSEGAIEFSIDTALFSLGLSDTLLLEAYQEIDVSQLAADDQGNCVYTTEITLETLQGDTLAWDIWNTSVTWSESGTAVNCTMLPALHGDLLLTVVMTDVNNGRRGTAVREFQVDGIGHFSDIELARTIMPSTEGSVSSLLKGSLIVYPAASNRFTVPGESMLYTYQEIYSLGGSNLLRHSRLLNADGIPVFSRSAEIVSIPAGVETVALLDSIDLTVVREPGLYSLSVVYTEGSDTLIDLDKPVFVDVSETAALYQNETELIRERRFNEFSLLLSNEEAELFSRLDADGRTLFYDNYWNARPGDHDAFILRCNLVASRYGSMGKEGWQSDRGRVYLIFGEPDEVESNPFSTTQAPLTVWSYFGTSQDTFVFADLMGNGDYLQVYSTVAGEVSYSNWQNMLQNVNSGTTSSDEEF